MKLDPFISPVVELLNSSGFETIGSCQGGEGHPKISCGLRKSNQAFVTVVSKENDEKEKLSKLLSDYKHKIHHINGAKNQRELFPNGWYYGYWI